MKLSVKKDSFFKALQKVSNIIASRNTLPGSPYVPRCHEPRSRPPGRRNLSLRTNPTRRPPRARVSEGMHPGPASR